MITYNYSLEVDMGTEKKVHAPRREIPKELKNIFRLQGPNSSGKSTLMNIIALSSHGLNKGKIPKSVKERMGELVAPGYKDLEFDLCIQDPVTKTILKSTKKKGNSEIIVRESIDGGKTFPIIAADQFEKKYNLIYDIPENPMGRLNELTREINSVQASFRAKIMEFQTYVENISYELSNSMSQEQIDELKKSIKHDEESLEAFDLKPDENRLNLLNKLKIAVDLSEYNDKANKAEVAYKKADKDFKETKKRNSVDNYGREIGKLSNTILLFGKIRRDMVISANKISYPEYLSLRQLSSEIPDDPNKIIENKGIPRAFVMEVEKLEKYVRATHSASKGDELKAMSELMRVLNQYKNRKMDLPAIGPIDAFLESFEAHYRKLNSEYDYEEIKKLEKYIESVLKNVKEINSKVSNIRPPQEDDLDAFQKESEFDLIKSQYDRAKDIRSKYIREISMPVDITLDNLDRVLIDLNASLNGAYAGKTSDEIRKAYLDEREKFQGLRDNKEKIENRLQRDRRTLSNEEAKKRSQYSNYSKEVDEIKNSVSSLRTEFMESGKKLDAIENGNYGRYDPNDPFFHSVWIYLGKRLRSVRHLDKEYVVDKINLVERIISAKDGTVIHLSDMGTGQSQLSYLTGLLSADDDRMIIALFDEVSTMTDSTLEVIFDKFQEIQKDGRLMVGMAVSPANEVSVKCYGL